MDTNFVWLAIELRERDYEIEKDFCDLSEGQVNMYDDLRQKCSFEGATEEFYNKIKEAAL